VGTAEKFGTMLLAIAIFVGLVGFLLLIAGRFKGRNGDRAVAAVFLGPAILGLSIGLIYPAVRTAYESFFNADGNKFVGLDNYSTIFSSHDQLIVLRNTALWVVLAPFLATGIGLIYAVLVDKARVEAFAKALVFLPMAISFVGASIIWKFVYDFRADLPGIKQIGLLNQVLIWLGGSPHQFLLNSPWNTVFLIIVMIWIQAGFAMTILSAAIKAIPDDIIEAARIDGVAGVGLFRYITLPSIRPALVVVLTTIGIGTLKVFDIVLTMTGGGNFGTSVVANEFYTQIFRASNQGLGSALAVLLFILVIPIVVYNIRQMRASEVR
jgi:alpha-glucoside transport system permease protein